MLGGQAFEIADQRRVTPGRQAALDPLLGGGVAQLLQTHRFGPNPVVIGQLAERRTPPPGQRRRVRPRRLAGLGEVTGLVRQPHELLGVDHTRGQLEAVAAAPGDDLTVRAQQPPSRDRWLCNVAVAAAGCSSPHSTSRSRTRTRPSHAGPPTPPAARAA